MKADHNHKPVEIVDRGRGPQLSSCRITVQDIMAIMPVFTKEDTSTVEQYVRDNFDTVMEQDRRIRQRNLERRTPLEIQEIRKKGHTKALALMAQLARDKGQEKNGDPSPRIVARNGEPFY